jgi:vancomycin permeability regulator SanA
VAIGATLLTLSIVILAAPTGYAVAGAQGRIETVARVPAKPVAIVFGAAVYPSGKPVPYLQSRLDLAYDLFTAGKVRAILVSGDNRRVEYNEPDAMRTYLIDRGVPAEKVVADYAGFDTYATCVRAVRIFGVTEAILTTQSYHLPRAITTCRAVGVDAWGVGDDTGQAHVEEWQQDSLREWPANLKMTWDLLSQRQPLLGKPESGIRDALKG